MSSTPIIHLVNLCWTLSIKLMCFLKKKGGTQNGILILQYWTHKGFVQGNHGILGFTEWVRGTSKGSTIYQLTPNLAIFYPPPPCWQSADTLVRPSLLTASWQFGQTPPADSQLTFWTDTPFFATKNSVEKCFSHQFFQRETHFATFFQLDFYRCVIFFQ